MNKPHKIGILGGGFNPVHIGHLMMADQVYHQLNLDMCYLMPTYQPPHIDKKSVINATDRVAMLNLATASNPHLQVELSEIERQGTSYTYDTICALKNQNPEVEYYFIIGGDMVEYLPKWYKIDELLHLVKFVAIRRPGYCVDTPYPVLWVDTPSLEISSTYIREQVEQKQSIRYLVPDDVAMYIKEKGLYQKNG